MSTQSERTERFRSLHRRGDPLLLPNLWDAGSARLLALPGGPTVPEPAALGVARVSVGGAFAFAALGAVVEAGRELLDKGTYGFWQRAGEGRSAARSAFGP